MSAAALISAGDPFTTAFGVGVVTTIGVVQQKTLTVGHPTCVCSIRLPWCVVYQHVNPELLTPSVHQLGQELNRRRPIVSKIKTHVKNLGHIPTLFRKDTYRVLLQVPRSKPGQGSISLEATKILDKELINQRVIRADVLRTRTQDSLFRQEQTRHELEILLTYYCKRKGCMYRQGLNEVLAPFVYVVPSSTELNLRFELFDAFSSKFLPNLFLQEEFTTLQLCHVLFSSLLRHHDIFLYEHFMESDLTPELYSTPWFLTYFAAKLSIQHEILLLWDYVLMLSRKEHLSYIYFFGLAALLTNRDILLSAANFDLPHTVVNLKINNIHQVLKYATWLQHNTPRYFTELVEMITLTPEKDLHWVSSNIFGTEAESTKEVDNNQVVEKLDHSLNLVVMPIFSKDIYSYFTSSDNSNTLKYYFLDVRTFFNYHRVGHFPNSFHIDPTVFNGKCDVTLEWVRRELEIFKSMSSLDLSLGKKTTGVCCLCVIGSHSDHTIHDAQQLIKWLASMRFNRLAMYIDFDELINNDTYAAFNSTYLIKSSTEDEAFALNTMSESIQAWKHAMEPEEMRAPPVPTKESVAPIQPESLEKKAYDTNGTNGTNGTNETQEMSTSLLSKGASALGSWWNRASLASSSFSTSFATSTTNNTNQRITHLSEEGDIVSKKSVLKLGGKLVRRIQEKKLIDQYLVVAIDAIFFLKHIDENENTIDAMGNEEDNGDKEEKGTEETEMVVLSKYPIRGLRKVASRSKNEQLILILTFSNSPNEGAGGDGAAAVSTKKVGFVAENKSTHKSLIATLRENYNSITTCTQ